MKKGFVFDLDGVITDTAKYHYIAWKELASEIGIEIDLKFNEQLKGISRMDSLERILTLGNKNDAYTEVEKEALATKKNTHYVQLLQSLTPDDLLPGVKTFLDEAKAKNIPCAIASASKNAPFILDTLVSLGMRWVSCSSRKLVKPEIGKSKRFKSKTIEPFPCFFWI